MNRAHALDHAAIAVSDLAAASAQWQGLGFALTPVAIHTDGAGVPTGTGNRCAMLGQGYIELISVVDPARPSRTLAGFIARYEGAHILSLAVNDAHQAQIRLAQAGIEAPLAVSSRQTDAGEARFERVPIVSAIPRLQLIHHLTPELVWRAEDLEHPNRTAALEEVLICAQDPAEMGALLCRVAGRPLRPDPAGGYAISLPQGSIRILSSDAMARLLPDTPRLPLPSLPLPCIAGVMVRTSDANRAVTARNIGRPVDGGRLGFASGTAVWFRPGGG